MVGVPGRSKGCSTCRRRKKGCDKTLPSCHQCLRAGLECGGYGRDLIWLNADAKPGPERSKAPWLSVYSVYAKPAQPALAESLALSAREQKYLGLFWSNYFPNGRVFSDAACTLSTGGWTRTVNALYASCATLRKAMLALSAGVLGARGGDAQLQIKGLQTYCDATADMFRAVQHPTQCRADGTLAAVRLLEFYEVLFGFGAVKAVDSSMASWWRHNDGQLALILLRGPESFRQGAAHELFVDARYNTALAAITRRRRCPLAQRAWKTIPWEMSEKSLKDALIDILVDVPGLMEAADSLKAGVVARDRVCAMYKRIIKDLHAWEREMGDRLRTYDYTHTPELQAPRCDDQVALLHLSNVYWGICLATYSTGAREQLEPRADFAGLRGYACKIARSVHLLFEPIAGDFGCNVALFPLLSAWRFFSITEAQDPSEELKIVTKLLGREFQGARVSSFAKNMQATTTPS